jgi:hypothetical protein
MINWKEEGLVVMEKSWQWNISADNLGQMDFYLREQKNIINPLRSMKVNRLVTAQSLSLMKQL